MTFQASEADVIDYKQRVADSGRQKSACDRPYQAARRHHLSASRRDQLSRRPGRRHTDTVAVRAQLPNPDGVLIPGGIVGVIVERGAPHPALVVPQAAVLLDQAGRYVMVVDDAKKVEQRRITTGTEQGRDIVVTDGLKEGELVIVEGIQKVHPGQIVTATVVPGN